jgi:hypothetical protein
MGEGELIRRAIGKPREKTEAEHIAWFKEAMAALGMMLPPDWDSQKSYYFYPQKTDGFREARANTRQA